MIHEMAVELAAKLSAQGCPLKVYDGPENTKTTTYARERIVVEHDTVSEKFGPVRSQRTNPKQRMIRNIAAKITIYAQNGSVGALDWEHRRRAEHILDLVLVQLESVCIDRKNGFAITGGRFVNPEDLAQSEIQGGAVYELTFTVERSVNAQTWAGDKLPEASVGSITNSNHVSGPGYSPQVGCGT